MGGTIFLSGLRQVLTSAGLVYETAPMQATDRLEKALSLEGHLLAKRATELIAHFGYGVSAEVYSGCCAVSEKG